MGQDFLDAAEILRRFLHDLTGELLPDPDTIDDEQAAERRAALLGHELRLHLTRGDVKRALIDAELYPHGVHLVHEGASEREVVEVLVRELLWEGALADLQFTDLHGAGAAKTMESLVAAVSGYALRAAVIVDREGDMADYVEALIERGTLPSEDVLLFEDSLESSNFSPAELIELVADLGRHPPEGREPAELQLDADTLTAFHADRRERAGKEKPGLGDSLRVLARRQEHGAVNFSKPELAERMARRMLAELDEARPGSFEPVFERRPVLRFVYGRIVGAINRPVPVS